MGQEMQPIPAALETRKIKKLEEKRNAQVTRLRGFDLYIGN